MILKVDDHELNAHSRILMVIKFSRCMTGIHYIISVLSTTRLLYMNIEVLLVVTTATAVVIIPMLVSYLLHPLLD